jgi:hypothetical protein
LLKRVRDYAEVHGSGTITDDIAAKALQMLEVDQLGLDDIDRRILRTIVEKFDGGPVGIETLAAATSEVHEHLTHRTRRRTEEVRSPFPTRVWTEAKFQERLVDKLRRGKRRLAA